MKHVYDDGGRKAAGYKGHADDCVCRAICVVTGKPYAEVYERLARETGEQRATKRTKKRSASARNGINVKRKWFRDYMAELGLVWHPTMQIGQGCKVHLADGELPPGRLVVSVSKHYTSVIDGVVHDTWNPQREAHCVEPDKGQELKPGQWRNDNGICSIQRRCVYGYWTLAKPDLQQRKRAALAALNEA